MSLFPAVDSTAWEQREAWLWETHKSSESCSQEKCLAGWIDLCWLRQLQISSLGSIDKLAGQNWRQKNKAASIMKLETFISQNSEFVQCTSIISSLGGKKRFALSELTWCIQHLVACSRMQKSCWCLCWKLGKSLRSWCLPVWTNWVCRICHAPHNHNLCSDREQRQLRQQQCAALACLLSTFWKMQEERGLITAEPDKSYCDVLTGVPRGQGDPTGSNTALERTFTAIIWLFFTMYFCWHDFRKSKLSKH